MKPYAIFLPELDSTSGGIKVMWGLYGYLLSRGIEIRPNVKYTCDSVAIYPEIVKGNPLGGSTVVRYILAPLGEMGLNGQPGPTEYDKTDKIYSFSKFIYETDDDHTMFLPIIDTNLFKDQGKKRFKNCLFVGKGDYTGIEPKGCIEIDRRFAQNQELLADFLNECQVMYCYDYRSAMMECARLCGVRVVLLSTKYPKEDYLKYEPGLNGVSFGLDEEVKLDTKEFRKTYLRLKDIFERKLDKFIIDSQK
jgi:hypothetical protein